MTLPTVIEITPQPQAVTPDTFIDGLTSPRPDRAWPVGRPELAPQAGDMGPQRRPVIEITDSRAIRSARPLD